MQIRFPEEINKIIEGLNYKIDDIGRSEDKVIIIENKYVLKISKNIDNLKREYDINEWLKDKIPCTSNVLFIVENDYAYYLRTCLNGFSLIDERFISNPDLLIESLCKTVNVLRGLDKYKCDFLSIESIGDLFTHGDLCLPNIYFDENNNFIGFIDLGSAGLGDIWCDYSWMLWSLEYNLKTDKYNDVLLNKLGIEFDNNKYEKYIPLEYRKK